MIQLSGCSSVGSCSNPSHSRSHVKGSLGKTLNPKLLPVGLAAPLVCKWVNERLCKVLGGNRKVLKKRYNSALHLALT